MTTRRKKVPAEAAATRRSFPAGQASAGGGQALSLGAAGEAAAAAYLARQGLAVVARNFRVRGGEIDLVCRDGGSVVFVEVRLRSRGDYGGAAASITAAKRARLVLAARHWLARFGNAPCRFDCVLIDGGRLEWIRNAFAAD